MKLRNCGLGSVNSNVQNDVTLKNEEKTVVRSVKQTHTGDKLYISVSDGMLSTTVTDIKENAL